MKLADSQINFLKNNEKMLSELINMRIEILKEEMVAEEDEARRNKIVEQIRENKNWLTTIAIEADKDKKGQKRDTGI